MDAVRIVQLPQELRRDELLLHLDHADDRDFHRGDSIRRSMSDLSTEVQAVRT
jgi:hypothetical protein